MLGSAPQLHPGRLALRQRTRLYKQVLGALQMPHSQISTTINRPGSLQRCSFRGQKNTPPFWRQYQHPASHQHRIEILNRYIEQRTFQLGPLHPRPPKQTSQHASNPSLPRAAPEQTLAAPPKRTNRVIHHHGPDRMKAESHIHRLLNQHERQLTWDDVRSDAGPWLR